MKSIGSREALNSSKSLKVSLYFCILDSMLGELRCRFEDKNLEIMKAIQACNPQSPNFQTTFYLAKQMFKDTNLDNITACLKEVCTLDAAFPA